MQGVHSVSLEDNRGMEKNKDKDGENAVLEESFIPVDKRWWEYTAVDSVVGTFWTVWLISALLKWKVIMKMTVLKVLEMQNVDQAVM